MFVARRVGERAAGMMKSPSNSSKHSLNVSPPFSLDWNYGMEKGGGDPETNLFVRQVQMKFVMGMHTATANHFYDAWRCCRAPVIPKNPV